MTFRTMALVDWLGMVSSWPIGFDYSSRKSYSLILVCLLLGMCRIILVPSCRRRVVMIVAIDISQLRNGWTHGSTAIVHVRLKKRNRATLTPDNSRDSTYVINPFSTAERQILQHRVSLLH
jgi:hypothetical protein